METKSLEQRLDGIERRLALTKSILTVRELSEYSGITVSQIYKLTHGRKIPFSKPTGKKLYFEKQKIDEWLLQNPVKTADQIEQQAVNYIVNNPKSL